MLWPDLQTKSLYNVSRYNVGSGRRYFCNVKETHFKQFINILSY